MNVKETHTTTSATTAAVKRAPKKKDYSARSMVLKVPNEIYSQIQSASTSARQSAGNYVLSVLDKHFSDQ